MKFFAHYCLAGLALFIALDAPPAAHAELVAHFPLDGDANSTVGGYVGEVDDGVEFVADGIIGGSAEFEGFGGIHVPYDEALNPEDAFTVTAWANPIDTTSWNSVVTSREDNGQSVNGYIIYNRRDESMGFLDRRRRASRIMGQKHLAR